MQLRERIVAKIGELNAVDNKLNCNGTWHYALSQAWKTEALRSLPKLMKGTDATELVWLAEEINKRIERVAVAKANALKYAHMATATKS